MRVLTIDDDSVSTFIIRENLRIINEEIEVNEKLSLVDALLFLRNRLKKKSIPDVIICDYNLPPYTAKDFLRIYKQHFQPAFPSTKIFIISASIDQNIRNEISNYDFITGVYNKADFDEKLIKIVSVD